MEFRNAKYIFFALALSITGLLLMLSLADVSSAFAQEQTGSFSLPRQPPPPDDEDLQFIAFFTDEFSIEITDIAGNMLGTGAFGGKVRCFVGNCSQKAQLTLQPLLTAAGEYEYKFETEQALDPADSRAVVAGTGTFSSQGQKERFRFTATILDNRDGTIWVRVDASRPDAAFIIPRAPGLMRFLSLRK